MLRKPIMPRPAAIALRVSAAVGIVMISIYFSVTISQVFGWVTPEKIGRQYASPCDTDADILVARKVLVSPYDPRNWVSLNSYFASWQSDPNGMRFIAGGRSAINDLHDALVRSGQLEEAQKAFKCKF